ncbi:MAG: prolipoprotein diacylglyceryl transferase [Ferruginibacter sp.]|nr:prolipoprotein diacylglyceryl transferase [Ferruginibacter sp.]
MYPNLYYVFKDWFGVEWNSLKFLNTFGLLVAISFIIAAWLLSLELKRREKQGLLLPKEQNIVVGKPASLIELLTNAIIGFLFGFKFLGLLFDKPESISAQAYIFSGQGSAVGGIFLATLLAGIKWWEKNKQKLKEPEKRIIRVWPHDRIGDIVVLGLVFGILGAKLFDNLEHWDEFWADPIRRLFSQSGLAFYGGLILATVAISWYSISKGIKLKYLVDAAAPALMFAYAVGRLGCQISGDGDWGIYNSAYISDNGGNVSLAKPGEFERALEANKTYFLEGKVVSDSGLRYVTDRIYPTLSDVPHRSFKGPSFLPNWFFAYSYPQNVNDDGIIIPGIKDDHRSVLPQPVFPTPLYETILCTFLFFVFWFIRKKIKTPLVIFSIYLIFNGLERLLIESIRVNDLHNFMGIKATQAEFIALLLILTGAFLLGFAKSISRLVD